MEAEKKNKWRCDKCIIKAKQVPKPSNGSETASLLSENNKIDTSTVSYENVTTRQRNKIRASSLEPQDNTFEKTMEDNSLTILEDTRMSLPDLNIAEHKELHDEISFLKTQLASAHLEIDRLNLQVTDLKKKNKRPTKKKSTIKTIDKGTCTT
ncbi:unnamed protein product [Parnassius apollo]|uniref:(apollo) hypothetical protein n=1 Tax=Parnassius apollo TaxID=110799 RepID=A0A8S3XKU9_PARAO|nr:unnamed protein product [Parnassius apollo]